MKKFDIARINQLKQDAFENIQSYDRPDSPKALQQFIQQIKALLMLDISMLESVPEYLPLALFERVKFSDESKLKWSCWINEETQPSWDEFKTTIAFNNADMPLVKHVREYSEELLIETAAVLFLLEHDDTPNYVDEDEGSSEHNSDEHDYDVDMDGDY